MSIEDKKQRQRPAIPGSQNESRVHSPLRNRRRLAIVAGVVLGLVLLVALLPTIITHTPLTASLIRRIAKLDALIAQGTHPPMSEREKRAKIGAGNGVQLPGLGRIFDHDWANPEKLATIGVLDPERVRELSGGLMDSPIEIRVNKLLAPGFYDTVLIFGTTAPHEVAGFSGGAKYFFPGVAGPELTHATHWLGALAGIERPHAVESLRCRDVPADASGRGISDRPGGVHPRGRGRPPAVRLPSRRSGTSRGQRAEPGLRVGKTRTRSSSAEPSSSTSWRTRTASFPADVRWYDSEECEMSPSS